MPSPSSAASTPDADADAALQETLDSERAALESAARADPAGTRSWLLDSPSPGDGGEQASPSEGIYEALEKRVSTPWFLEAIERALLRARSSSSSSKKSKSISSSSDSKGSSSADVTKPEWWSPPAGVEAAGAEENDDNDDVNDVNDDDNAHATSPPPPPPASSSSPPSHLDETPYVLVSRDDVVDAVAHFVACYVASLPQSRDLSPKELRSALATTMRELGRRGRAKKIWAWGKWLYRAAALSYGAFGAYTNPWLARAVLAALWTSAKVMVATVVQ